MQTQSNQAFVDALMGPLRWTSTNLGVPVGIINGAHTALIERVSGPSTFSGKFASRYLSGWRWAGRGFALLDAGVHLGEALRNPSGTNWALFGASATIAAVTIFFPVTGMVLGIGLLIVEEGILPNQ
jgi:hypothetical protein